MQQKEPIDCFFTVKPIMMPSNQTTEGDKKTKTRITRYERILYTCKQKIDQIFNSVFEIWHC